MVLTRRAEGKSWMMTTVFQIEISVIFRLVRGFWLGNDFVHINHIYAMRIFGCWQPFLWDRLISY